jgi:hypothetical protein
MRVFVNTMIDLLKVYFAYKSPHKCCTYWVSNNNLVSICDICQNVTEMTNIDI